MVDGIRLRDKEAIGVIDGPFLRFRPVFFVDGVVDDIRQGLLVAFSFNKLRRVGL